MIRCGRGMMIECEVKTRQTVESIEHTRRKRSEGGELGEDSIWQGGQSVVVEGMKGMRV